MFEPSFLISIVPFAAPVATGLVSAGIITLAEKVLPSNKA